MVGLKMIAVKSWSRKTYFKNSLGMTIYNVLNDPSTRCSSPDWSYGIVLTSQIYGITRMLWYISIYNIDQNDQLDQYKISEMYQKVFRALLRVFPTNLPYHLGEPITMLWRPSDTFLRIYIDRVGHSSQHYL